MKKLLLIIILFFAVTELDAQQYGPNDPGGSPVGAPPLGGGAPVGSGTMILSLLAFSYGAGKIITGSNAQKENKEPFEK
jgi:hypothetical protein